jgi:hypothetical protein
MYGLRSAKVASTSRLALCDSKKPEVMKKTTRKKFSK